tara:strand:+ start:1275 stop:3038 length:1764 start_codon:yes stop_codon:yes gene_type:complete
MQQKELTPEKIDLIIELYSSGQIQDALDSIKLLSEEFQSNPLLINISGACFNSLGQYENAIESYEKAIAINPDYVDAHYNLGNIYRQIDQLDNAIECHQRVIDINPSHEEAQYNLGVSLFESGFLFEAIDHFEKALVINPKNIEAQINLGNIFVELDQTYEAIEQYEKILITNPKNALAYNSLGIIFHKIGQMNEAIEYFEKALELDQDYADTFYNLGFTYQDLGQIDEAIRHYECATNINNHAMAYHSLSHLKSYKPNDILISHLQSLHASDKLSQADRIHICLALANIYEKFGMEIDFFKYLNEGNSLQKKELNYSLSQSLKEHESIKKLFKLPLPSASKAITFYPTKIRPIFIVGMPRSGTSLVEQIISSHHSVFGAGELNTITALSSPVIKNFITGDINKLTQKTISFIRDEYIDMMSVLNSDQKIITDKLPLNFQYIGFILSAFPEAKIIHLKRDARATCWSNYKYYFESKNNGYSNNFDDLAGFYASYNDLMNFWHKLYPNKIYDMNYEHLTNSQEEETRKLLEYCNLDWDENCLNFHTNKRAVKTISALQVREKMYQGSSEAWKKHWAYIQPLTDALKPY